MKCLFVITETMQNDQLEQAYLLILAHLNFDHQVQVVFTGNAYQQLASNEQQLKPWRALKLYGIDGLWQLGTAQHDLPSLDHEALNCLVSESEWVS